jgi:mannose-1-phosphate guanylyltransferase
VIFSQEPLPLGTAGAVKYAEHYINNGPFLVVNGDSFARVDINAMLGFHASRNARATIALSRIDDSSDFGTVKLDNNNRIISFSEKDPAGGPAFVNAGIYLFETSVLSLIPKGVKFSLEHEVFNTITDCYGFKTDARLVDIGTKERYNEAQKIFSSKDCI